MIDDEISYLVASACRCRRLAEQAQETALRDALIQMATAHLERVRHLAAYDSVEASACRRTQTPGFAHRPRSQPVPA